MTSTPSTTPDNEEIPEYPGPWRHLDLINEIEVRQNSVDTFQLRSKTHTLMLNKEGFGLYRDRSEDGRVIFEDWCTRHGIYSEPRDDDESQF